MKSINIMGKDYIEVNERVKYFTKNFTTEGWKLITQMLKLEDGMCIFKASVLNENNEVVSTGHAYEREDSSFINKTSFIENCETSAVGRALGFLGIGIDLSIASKEEVENAKLNQGKEPVNDDRLKVIKLSKIVVKNIADGNVTNKQVEDYNKEFGVEKFRDLSYARAKAFVDMNCKEEE